MKKLINISRQGLSIFYAFVTLFLIELCLSSCSEDELKITQNFPFEIVVMPVQKDIANGETVEIRCRITSSGSYSGTWYLIRYFQSDGKGSLRVFNDPVMQPNDLHPLQGKEFRLYYTSASTISQSFDIWVADNLGNEQKVSFQFNYQNAGIL